MRSVEKTPSERTIAPLAKTATSGSGAANFGPGDWAARDATPSNNSIRMERESFISA
jgi:hypothetical protein